MFYLSFLYQWFGRNVDFIQDIKVQKIATSIPTGVDHIQDGDRAVCTFYMYDVVASTIASAVHKAFPTLITEEYAKPRSVAAELDIEGSSQELLPEHAEL